MRVQKSIYSFPLKILPENALFFLLHLFYLGTRHKEISESRMFDCFYLQFLKSEKTC